MKKKILGYAMISMLFAVLFCFAVTQVGFLSALMVFGITIGIVAFVVVAVTLTDS